MDEIFGERFLGRKEPAWHRLGNVFAEDEEKGVEEAVREVGAGYELRKVKYPNIVIDGRFVDIPRYGVFREPTGDDDEWRWLGDVSEGYEVLDNITIARTIEPLARSAKFKGGWPLETVGALGKGERFFVTLKIGRTVLNGSDEVDRYFFVFGNHANGRGVHVAVTTVRVVCANTVEMALNESSANGLNVRLDHVEGVEADLAVASSLMAKMHAADDEAVRLMESMALTKVTERQIAQIINAAYPQEKPGRKMRFLEAAEKAGFGDEAARFQNARADYEHRVKLMDWNRDAARKCLVRLDRNFPDIAGTAWAVLNAVTEVENHRPGQRDPSESILFGDRAGTMKRALQVAANFSRGNAPARPIVSLPGQPAKEAVTR